MLAQEPPFSGSIASVMQDKVAGRLRPLDQVAPSLRGPLTDVLQRCLAVHPGHRPTAAEVAAALSTLFENGPRSNARERHAERVAELCEAPRRPVLSTMPLRSSAKTGWPPSFDETLARALDAIYERFVGSGEPSE